MRITPFILAIFAVLCLAASAQATTIDLTPVDYSGGTTITNAQRGLLFQALEDTTISSAGISAMFTGTRNLTLNIWSATYRLETGRWATEYSVYRDELLATNTVSVGEASALQFYDVDIDFTFEAGQYYEISFDVPYVSSDSYALYGYHNDENVSEPTYYTVGSFLVMDGTAGDSGSGTRNNTAAPAIRVEAETAAVPVPGAVWLLGAGLSGLLGLRRKA